MRHMLISVFLPGWWVCPIVSLSSLFADPRFFFTCRAGSFGDNNLGLVGICSLLTAGDGVLRNKLKVSRSVLI